MKTPWIIALTAAAVLIAGCEEKPPYQPPLPHTDPNQSKLFEPQREALDKAKGVQQTLDEKALEQRQQVEQAEK